LRYHQGLQPRPYPQRGSRQLTAGTQLIYFINLEKMNE
jgi:hypothetical protein